MKISKYPLYNFYSEIDLPFQVNEGIFINSNDINIEIIDTYNISDEDEHHLKEVNRKVFSKILLSDQYLNSFKNDEDSLKLFE